MRKKALWEQREETPVETRAHSSEAAFPSVTYPYTSPSTADTSDADTVHPGGPRRAPAADAEAVCKREDGCIHRPSSFTLLALAHRSALAGCRRATHVDLEGPAPALRRHLCSRRRPPIGARRPRPAADAEAVCKREEGRLPPPSGIPLPCSLLRASRLPSRNSRRPRRCSFRSTPTSLQPTPSPQRRLSSSPRRRCRSHLQTRRGSASDAPLEFRCLVRSYAPAGCRRATHVDLEGAPSALRRHLCSRRRPPSGARRPPAADAEAVCKREEGRLPPPSGIPLPCSLLRASRLPSRNSRRPRRCSFRSTPTSLQPTPSPQRRPSSSSRRRCRSHLQTRRGSASDAPLECRCLVRSYAPAGCRRATHVDLEGAPPTLRRHLCSRRRPPSGTRRPRPADDAEAVCKREEGQRKPPLLNAATLCAVAR